MDAIEREKMQHMVIVAETRKIEAEIEKLNAEQRLVRVKGTVNSILLICAAVAGVVWLVVSLVAWGK